MQKIISLYIFSLFVFHSSSVTFAAQCSTAYNFDYLLLSTQWPESFCETEKCVQHEDAWSIHGAWPQYTNGSWPQDCCFDKEYRAEQIQPIKAELVKHWKTLKAGGTDDEFWSHEWTKHGTCAKDSALLNGELNYFKNSLEAFKALSLDQWLSDSGITPSKTKAYSVTDFHSAITKGLGFKVQLLCLTKKHNSSAIISEIHICLNKDTLKPFNCPNNMDDQHCGTSIAYLPTTQ